MAEINQTTVSGLMEGSLRAIARSQLTGRRLQEDVVIENHIFDQPADIVDLPIDPQIEDLDKTDTFYGKGEAEQIESPSEEDEVSTQHYRLFVSSTVWLDITVK